MITEITAHTEEKVKESFDNLYKVAEENDILKFFMEVGTSTDYSKGYTSVEGVEDAEEFDETGTLKKVRLPEGYKIVSEASEYGAYMETTKKEMLNTEDQGTLVKTYEDKKVPGLISSLQNKRQKDAFALLNGGLLDKTDPNVKLAPDAEPIYGTHKFKSSDVTFTNKTNIAGGEDALKFLDKYAGELVDSQGNPIACRFNLIIVKQGGDASIAFKKVFEKNGMKATTIADVNIYNNGTYTLLETPRINSGTAWFAFDTKKDKPFILDEIQKPTLDKSMFDNVEQTWTHSATGSKRVVCANLPFYTVGSTGTGA